jgi:predicted amidohydrolase YtcJ
MLLSSPQCQGVRTLMNPRNTISIFLIVLFAVVWYLNTSMNADLIIINSRIYTLDRHGAVAEAMAVRGGKIAAAGSREDILRSFRAPKTMDLEGYTVLPGLIDAHAHMLNLGLGMVQLDLADAARPEEIAALVRRQADAIDPGEWIIGRGWDQNRWDTAGFPDRSVLDRVVPDHPVYLVRVDGHAAWVNGAALHRSGITPHTEDPAGGLIHRGRDGEPTGILIDAAMALVSDNIPEPGRMDKREAMIRAIRECVSYGITTVHDMGMNQESIEIFREIVRDGDAVFRLYAAIDGVGETWDRYLRTGRDTGGNDGMLTVRAIKLYADGALGSRGAALTGEYSDDPGNYGLLLASEDDIYTVAVQALDNGFQVCTHAIGDRGIRTVLRAYQRALDGRPTADHRFRIEHVQVVDPIDIPTFAEYGILPGMQPLHCTSDMAWAEDRLGADRVAGAYAWRSFIDHGSIIAGGSDFPVEPVNPLLGIFAAETRQDDRFLPANGWLPEQRVSRTEAVYMFTKWAAYAGFEESMKGTIEPGKLADFVVYPEDIMTIEAKRLLTIRPAATIINGEIVYRRSRSDGGR